MSTHRLFYALMLAGLVASFLALGITITTRLAANTQAVDHALVLSERAQIATLRARQAESQARSAQGLVMAIAQERAQAILTVCEQQNVRHDATLRELRTLSSQERRRLHKRAQRAQLKANLRNTVLLIDALVPEQNCQALLAQLSQR